MNLRDAMGWVLGRKGRPHAQPAQSFSRESKANYPSQSRDGTGQSILRGHSGLGEYANMNLSTAYACGRLIASTGGSLPAKVFRKDGQGQKSEARDERLFRLLRESPNADQTAGEYFEMLLLDTLFHGDHIAHAPRNAVGDVTALIPLAPQNVRVVRGSTGAREYHWRDGTVNRVSDESEIFHVRGFGGDLLRGRSVISYGADALRRARNVESAADGLFENGIRPSGVFELPAGQYLSDEQFDVWQKRIEDRYVGAANAGRPITLEGGATFRTIQMSADDAQLLQSRGFSVEEICRLFGVPPFMVGYTEKSTSWGTGIEQQLLGFQKFTLTPHLRRIEQAIHKQLVPVAKRDQLFVEFGLEGILRADSAGRAAFYQTMTQIGAMTINEVRGLENLPPVAGGDDVRVQMQNVPIDKVAA